MIRSVLFTALIPVGVSERETSFRTADGWRITEEAPGRVRLARGDVMRVVQGYPYTLDVVPEPAQVFFEPAPAPEPSGPSLRKARRGQR